MPKYYLLKKTLSQKRKCISADHGKKKKSNPSKYLKIDFLNNFLHWLEDTHLVKELELVRVTEHGLFSRKQIEAGEKIVKIPRTCILSCQKAFESELGQKFYLYCKEADFPISGEEIFWIWLYEGKIDSSHPFHKYLITLPDPAPDPLNWPTELQDKLKDTILMPTLSKVIDDTYKLSEAFFNFCASNNKEYYLTKFSNMMELHKGILWARGVHRSRRLPGILCGEQHEVNFRETTQCDTTGFGILVPLLDKTNHDPNAKISWHFDDNFIWYQADERIEPNSEIFMSYGPKSNENLLMDFGFAIKDNPFDVVNIIFCAKNEISTQRHGPFQLRRSGDSRWEAIPSDIWSSLMKFQNSKPNERIPTKNVVKVLKDQLIHRLNLLKNTLSEDEVLLNDNNKPTIQHYVAYYRDGQRQILKGCLSEIKNLLC